MSDHKDSRELKDPPALLPQSRGRKDPPAQPALPPQSWGREEDKDPPGLKELPAPPAQPALLLPLRDLPDHKDSPGLKDPPDLKDPLALLPQSRGLPDQPAQSALLTQSRGLPDQPAQPAPQVRWEPERQRHGQTSTAPNVLTNLHGLRSDRSYRLRRLPTLMTVITNNSITPASHQVFNIGQRLRRYILVHANFLSCTTTIFDDRVRQTHYTGSYTELRDKPTIPITGGSTPS
jgi:hypothetical protein